MCRNYKSITISLYQRILKRNYSDKVREILFAPSQCEDPKATKKVSIVGASGLIGATSAYNLILKNICDEIVLLDITKRKRKLCGHALDYLHFSSQTQFPRIKISIDGEHTRNSNLLILCLGEKIYPNNSCGVLRNIEAYRNTVPKLASLSPNAVILVNTEPVELMTYAAWKYSGFHKNRVIGTGTELNSSRFRFLIAKKLGISSRSVNAWIIGGQGLYGVPVWSSIDIAGTRLREVDPLIATNRDVDNWMVLFDQVVNAHQLLSDMKGPPNWAVGNTIETIAEAILGNTKTVHAVTTNSRCLYGSESNVFLSLPSVLGNKGVIRIVKQNLSEDEQGKLSTIIKCISQAKKSVNW